jgi:fatty-acyl-CoA synthase
MSASTSPSTLCELLTEGAARGAGGYFFHLGDETIALPVAELYEKALKRAAQLDRAGIGRGEKVGLLGPNSPAWAEWAWGTWLAGCVLVPLPAPLRVRDPAAFSSQVASLAAATSCAIIAGEARYLELLDGERCPRWDWACEARPAPGQEPARVSPSHLAMVLCTSGSTSEPKGVGMSHARAMVWARDTAANAISGDVPAIVSWLPFFHIGGLGPLFEVVTPVDWHVLSMERFARDPAEWLRLVARTRACFTVGPSSAWEAALRGLARGPEGVDLSCLKGAVFNAETVDPDVAGRLAEVCVPLGLEPRAINVHYASSEAGMVSRTEPCEQLRVDVVDLHELARSSRALAPKPGHPSKRVVSCGVLFPGVEVSIGSPTDPLPERHLGEVWVRGDGVTDGYVNTTTGGLFMGDWFRIGDLGYMAEGELFVTGRSNEVIVRLGQKYHPEDIEQAVQHATSIPPGSCVAFSPLEGRQGDVVVVVEAGTSTGDLAGEVSAAITNAMGLTPSEVLLVPKGTIPTTPNGKLQRARARQMHHLGELATLAVDVAPPGS